MANRSILTFEPPPRARGWLRACLQEVLTELRADADRRPDGTADREFAVSNLVATLSVKAALDEDERLELFNFLQGRATAK